MIETNAQSGSRKAGSSTSAHDDFDELHTSVLGVFSELVTELGGDADLLLQRQGLASRDSPMTYRHLVGLLQSAAVELDCPDFGMRLASRQDVIPAYGPLGTVMRNAPTYGEAVGYASTHMFAHSLAARIWWELLGPGDGYFVGYDILLDGIIDKSQAIEQILLLGQRGAIEITGGFAKARKIHFRHQPLSSLATYRQYFNCETCFGQNEDGLFYSHQDMVTRSYDRSHKAFLAASSLIDQMFTRHTPPVSAQVRGMIMKMLGSADCTKTGVAVEMGLNARTMHRRLTAEGTSFQEVKDDVRRDLMLYYLKRTSMSFAAISDKLDFAEQAVMSRTCRRWFARSPTAVRHEND